MYKELIWIAYSTGIAGLAVTYGINLNVLQAAVIWNICNAENKMISVERILQYSNINSEAPLTIEDSRPPDNWPDTGTISFTNLQVSLHRMRYYVSRTCSICSQAKPKQL